ncbi:hypothetical protein C7451_12315 [Blastomonas natatoria]|uniref:Uncharacterized protein n=1 Tax=Blastomonas natatoria TaxID=34015 RepID=A0A2V3UNE8_9SPHN|nr:hypothetical protein [Blastomonas natatoria]PXW67879.1 hypothetical protein C7451_12315 [Blastomonas natatoria]
MADQIMTAQMPGFRFTDPAIAQPEAPAAAPRQLKYWSAYRSGPTLSVSGMDAETGTTRTITGVSSLGPGPDSAICITDGEGQRWELVL